MDICLSTQTNDLPGQVRTTGKLPLYLAAGKYILASRVGEASLVMCDEMLVDYAGVRDESYPRELADRVTQLLNDRGRLARGADNVAVARLRFDYGVLSQRLAEMLDSLCHLHS